MNLTQQQERAADRLYSQHFSCLYGDVGSGKTIVMLTALNEMLAGEHIDRCLIVAPKRVCQFVWPEEKRRWNGRLPGLGEIRCAAGENAGIRESIVRSSAPVVAINYENLPWLIQAFPKLPGGRWGLILDECDKMKVPTTKRFHAMFDPHRKIKGTYQRDFASAWNGQFAWRVIATGTPAHKNALDVWGQFAAAGHRIYANSFYEFRRRFAYKSDYTRQWEPFDFSMERILKSVEHMVVRMTVDNEGDLPQLRVQPPRLVDMPDSCIKQYRALKEEFLLTVETGKGEVDIDVTDARQRYGALRQIAQGFIYTELGDNSKFNRMHDAKWRELASLLSEMQGQQVIAYYQYEHDRRRMEKELGAATLGRSKDAEVIREWNAGNIPLLAANPASAGHGLNLQHSAAHHIVFFTPPETAGLYAQSIGRLHRRGNAAPAVYIHFILSRGTVDVYRQQVLFGRVDNARELIDFFKTEGL